MLPSKNKLPTKLQNGFVLTAGIHSCFQDGFSFSLKITHKLNASFPHPTGGSPATGRRGVLKLGLLVGLEVGAPSGPQQSERDPLPSQSAKTSAKGDRSCPAGAFLEGRGPPQPTIDQLNTRLLSNSFMGHMGFPKPMKTCHMGLWAHTCFTSHPLLLWPHQKHHTTWRLSAGLGLTCKRVGGNSPCKSSV